MKINFEKSRIIVWLIIIMPLIDTLNGMKIRDSDGFINLGQIYRVVILVMLINYLFKYQKRNISICLILAFAVFCIVQLVLPPFTYYTNNVLCVLKLFIPIFMFFALTAMIEKNRLNMEDICNIFNKIALLTPLTILIPYILGIGHHTYEGEAGYLGFYFSTNEISFLNSVIILYLITKLDMEISKKYLILFVLNSMSVLLVGTKSGYAVLATCIFLFALRFFSLKKSSSRLVKLFVIMLTIVTVAIGMKIFAENITNIYQRWVYGIHKNSNKSVIYFLTSGRIDRIVPAWEKFTSGRYAIVQQLFGWGLGGVNHGQANCEMDFFDLLYGSGWIGFITIMFIYKYMVKKIRRSFWAGIILIFVFVLSFAGGHVLYAGLGGMSLSIALVYAVCESKIEKRN